jgi:hypothetical protein
MSFCSLLPIQRKRQESPCQSRLCVCTNTATAHAGTAVRFVCLSAGLPARSQCAAGRSCDRPTGSRRSVPFLSHTQTLSRYPNYTSPCRLLMQPPRVTNISSQCCIKHNMRPQCSTPSLCRTLKQCTCLHLAFFTSQCCTFPPA